MIAVKNTEQQDFNIISKNVVRGEAILLPRSNDDNLIIMTEDDFLNLKRTREDKANLARKNALKALKDIQQQTIKSGAEEMTMEEINAEIAECRKEKNS